MNSRAGKCALCGGATTPMRIKYDEWVGDRLIVIDDVPVRQCASCGEQFMTASIARKIEVLLEDSAKGSLTAKTTLSVPLLDLA